MYNHAIHDVAGHNGVFIARGVFSYAAVAADKRVHLLKFNNRHVSQQRRRGTKRGERGVKRERSRELRRRGGGKGVGEREGIVRKYMYIIHHSYLPLCSNFGCWQFIMEKSSTRIYPIVQCAYPPLTVMYMCSSLYFNQRCLRCLFGAD